MSTEPRIRPKVISAFCENGRILVYPITDHVTGETVWRTFGGGIELGERSTDALRREVLEETGHEVDGPALLGLLEISFTWNGAVEHEICFVFHARFRDASVYEQEIVRGVEANGDELLARWMSLDDFGQDRRLVPEGLLDLLRRSQDPAPPSAR